jgi:hypothetical protein
MDPVVQGSRISQVVFSPIPCRSPIVIIESPTALISGHRQYTGCQDSDENAILLRKV